MSKNFRSRLFVAALLLAFMPALRLSAGPGPGQGKWWRFAWHRYSARLADQH